MIKKIIISFTFLFTLLTYGQNSCDCAENLSFIRAEIENNSAFATLKTFGENTGGLVSYSKLRKLEIPNLSTWTGLTQKKMIFYNDADFEIIGIALILH